MMRHTLTIFTPTCNRAATLVRTYESMCRQSCEDFEWLIIDDGSTDNTATLVEKWKREDRIPIQYVYKENGGLHTGYNKAIELINTELCMCVDSDDWLPDDAVEKIVSFWNKNKTYRVAGILCVDCTKVGKRLVG